MFKPKFPLLGFRSDSLPIHLLILIAVSATVFFTNLGEAHLWDRDEPRNAGCAAEMMARGDWVVPMFNDELRQQKPVLLYWLIMSAYAVFGQTEFAARYWSAILGIGTVLVTYGIGRRLAGPAVGLLAGVILSTSVMFDVAARAATPDSALVFCSTLAVLLYVFGTFSPATADGPAQPKRPGCWFPKNYIVVLGIYVMLGVGVLAKGPVGFVLPMAILGMFMLIQRLPTSRREDWHWFPRAVHTSLRPFFPVHFLKTLWSMRPITAAVVILLVAGPWYALVHVRTDGDFTRLFLFYENFGRATMPMESHGGGLWFYPLAILIGFFPWSVFWTPIAASLLTRDGWRTASSSLEILALCWIGVQVGAFSVAQTKLPSYITPCYPALALLTGACLYRWVTRETRISPAWYYTALGGLISGGALVVVGLGIVVAIYLPGPAWLPAIGAVPIIGGIIAILLLHRGEKLRTIQATAATAFAFCVVLFGFGTVAVDSSQHHDRVLSRISASDSTGIIASYRALESSWVYYGGRPIYECAINDSSDKRSIHRQKFWQRKPRVAPEALVEVAPGTLFLTTDEHVEELLSRLPAGYAVVESTDYFLKEDRQLLLLGISDSRLAELESDANVR